MIPFLGVAIDIGTLAVVKQGNRPRNGHGVVVVAVPVLEAVTVDPAVVGVAVAVSVDVGVGVAVSVGVGVGVAVSAGVDVGVAVSVGVGV